MNTTTLHMIGNAHLSRRISAHARLKPSASHATRRYP
jgi:hypothetical protein